MRFFYNKTILWLNVQTSFFSEEPVGHFNLPYIILFSLFPLTAYVLFKRKSVGVLALVADAIGHVLVLPQLVNISSSISLKVDYRGSQ